jgi:hypothetical protein
MYKQTPTRSLPCLIGREPRRNAPDSPDRFQNALPACLHAMNDAPPVSTLRKNQPIPRNDLDRPKTPQRLHPICSNPQFPFHAAHFLLLICSMPSPSPINFKRSPKPSSSPPALSSSPPLYSSELLCSPDRLVQPPRRE